MRTTIRMDDDLFAMIKAEAAATGQSLTAFIEEAVRRQLSAHRANAEYVGRDLPTFAGDGVLPGIDLDDSSALLDSMEGR